MRLVKPPASLMQPIQQGAGQGTKRLAALPTMIALQSVGVAVPNHVHRITVRHLEAPLDMYSQCLLRIQRYQFNLCTLSPIGR